MEGTLPWKLCTPFKHSESECLARRAGTVPWLKFTEKKQKSPDAFVRACDRLV